jgi:hypothetical protein
MEMISAGQRATGRSRARPQVVIVLDAARAGNAYRVEAPDRVLRLFGLLEAARDELDLTTVPPHDRARLQRLLEAVSAELERSVSPALADELHELVRHEEAEPSAGELRIEYSTLLGWTSGLLVAMFDELAATRDKLHMMSQASGTRVGQGHDDIDTALFGSGRRADALATDTPGPRPNPHPAPAMGARPPACGQ